MNDREKEGTWVWDSDSTPVLYQNWGPSSYNGNRGKEHNCAIMLAAGFWHEIACQNDGRVRDTKMICQKIEGLYHSLFYSLF